MSRGFVSADQAARDRIRDSLDETLFVEAGAGTGKTTSLVDRMLGLVSTGRATLDRIAVITFTESAAAELRDRVREALEKAVDDSGRDDRASERCHQGIRDIDQASIQTLHSFAADLLQARPLEAGLPPGFQVMDRIAADLDFEDEWKRWLDATLDDAATGQSFALAISLGMSLVHMRDIAVAFHGEYDRLDGVSFESPAEAPATSVDALVRAAPELDRLCQYARLGEDDPLVGHVRGVLSSTRRLQEVESPSPAAFRLLVRAGPIRTRSGNVSNWENDADTGQNACTLIKESLEDLDELVREELARARLAALAPVLSALQTFIEGYASKRKRQGVAQFQDLLVWARDLLRDDPEVRDHFRERFAYLLIDEVQDVDPLQAEIALLLSQRAEREAADRNGDHPIQQTGLQRTGLPVAPGRLFVVGDPKQSIYRFRRADISQVQLLQESMGPSPTRLVQNFRTQKPVIAWVNQLFGTWMDASPGQAEYVPLVPRWEGVVDHPFAPRAWHIGSATDEKNVGPMREQEAEAVAHLLTGIATADWQVLDRQATADAKEERYRPARYSDVCILMPVRTAIRTLELALEEGGVPYRLEGASLIFETQEVRDLLNCLRAIDDPADQVSLVAALRSPAFACSDEDLLEFAQGKGSFDYLDPRISGTRRPSDGPVANGMSALLEYHQGRLWSSTAMLIERVIRERRLIEAAMGRPRPRGLWRRYQFLVDQARAFVQAGGGPLRAFLTWADRQISEGTRVTEVPVPEGDEDAVRVMTVHAAKGLEFPIVVLVGLNADRSRSDNGPVIIDRQSGAVEVGVGSKASPFQTPGYQALSTQEKGLAEQEFVRLLYVAATRARDHLVVSMFRTASDTGSAAALIAGMMEGHDELWDPAPYGDVSAPVQEATPSSVRALTDPSPREPSLEPSMEGRERWMAERTKLVADRSRPASVAATTLAQVAKIEAVSDEPWRRGRGGTSLGRAVHAVLQTVDLATGRGLDETATAQATAEGIAHRADEVARLARVALDSDVVRRAVASGRFWREVPVAAPLGPGAIDGFIDLLFQDHDHQGDGQLIVVDYKTDTLEVDETADAAQRYRLQAGAYALALMESTGHAVREVVFLFLQPKREEALNDIAELVSEARAAALRHLGEATE